MNVAISGRHMEVTGALKSHIENRLEKLRSHFSDVIDTDVVLTVERHRHIADVTLSANGLRIHAKEASDDMYNSVDRSLDRLEKQVRKYKDRINRYQAPKASVVGQYAHSILEAHDEEPEADEEPVERVPVTERHRVVLRETLDMKPMNVEEASMQLELSGDDFLVFSNADTQKVNVIYARKDGSFGLIEPAF